MSDNSNPVPTIPIYPKVDNIGALTSCNHLLGDREALKQFWDENGYWYFKDVLDKEVIAELRGHWIVYLQKHGLIDEGVNENRYNHSGFEDKAIEPSVLSRIPNFNESNLHKILTENPKINATMKELMGDEPFWLPIAEYRANPPIDDPEKTRLIYPHQDSFYSRGLKMKICWIPVDTVDPDIGGCAWLAGGHKGPILHDLNNPPLFPIPTDAIPRDGWKSGTFEPGDIVLFDLDTPHSGLTNISKDRFRMSFDIRVTEASGKVPSIGKVVSLTENQVIINNEGSGAEERFVINPDTFVRSIDGIKREGADIPFTFNHGETILVNSDDGKAATLVRSIH